MILEEIKFKLGDEASINLQHSKCDGTVGNIIGVNIVNTPNKPKIANKRLQYVIELSGENTGRRVWILQENLTKVSSSSLAIDNVPEIFGYKIGGVYRLKTGQLFKVISFISETFCRTRLRIVVKKEGKKIIHFEDVEGFVGRGEMIESEDKLSYLNIQDENDQI